MGFNDKGVQVDMWLTRSDTRWIFVVDVTRVEV